MANKVFHVTPNDEKWQVRSEESKQASSIHDSKDEALDTAKSHAQNNNGSVIVHNKDGEIEQRLDDF